MSATKSQKPGNKPARLPRTAGQPASPPRLRETPSPIMWTSSLWTFSDVYRYTEIMADDLAARMQSSALALIGTLDERQRTLAVRPFTDTKDRRWLEYRPEYRPGAC